MFEGINLIAVLVAGIVFFVLGGLWYAVVFAKPVAKAMNFNAEQEALAKTAFPRNLGIHFVSVLLLSFMMAHALKSFDVQNAMTGVQAGVGLWIGFVFPFLWIHTAFEQRSTTMFWINGANALVSLVVIGIILALRQ